MIMGLVVYSFQGQYSFNPAYQGVHPKLPYTGVMTDMTQASQTQHIDFKRLETLSPL
jgi:hypothetical protein